MLPAFARTKLEPLSKVIVGPPATEVVALQVKKHEHILSSMLNSEATCWALDSVHSVAQTDKSATSNSEVSAGVDPRQVVSAIGVRTENIHNC